MGLDEVDMNISIEASTTEIPLLQDLGKTLRYMNRGGTSYIKLTNSWGPFDIQLGPLISANFVGIKNKKHSHTKEQKAICQPTKKIQTSEAS